MSMVRTELKARSVMTRDPVSIPPTASIRELATLLEENGISGVPVVEHSGRVVGIVSKTDLIRRCLDGTGEMPPAYLFETLAEQGDEEQGEVVPEPDIRVEDFMTEDPLMVSPEVSAVEVARLMHEKRVHRVIVADRERLPIGIITSLDLLGALFR